ncbi:MAG TPA: GNAT family N-acetyltransferase [Candidatus Saccharimonadia bacterium]
MAGVTIRRGTPDDFTEAQRLNHAHFEYEHAIGCHPQDSFNLNWTYEPGGVEALQKWLSGTPGIAAWFAEVDGRLVGYLMAVAATLDYRTANPMVELRVMFIEEPYRRQGIGTQLMTVFKDWAREQGAKRLKVGSYTPNHQAIAFYRRHGFKDFELYLEQSFE